ncbi:ABC transporter substrate-binding protein [uncultured Methylobacterium sp.]|jgi:NitT/TauT family transport system substrate-binding protein|uniref:ABC transporter substrate-binding protein n=1 Tax=uncultured Methylobacterium sp. TaxID=157278 RepID=UPI0026341421|nr:ABC transporter substrate-binding protein [uncultured Methylobacterium sp.]
MLKRRHLLAAFAAALLAGPAAAAEPVKASLRLKWLPQAQFAGFYVAAQKGYYKAEGLDLTINPGGPNLLTENLVATGADTFGLSGGSDSVFAARDKGLPVVCIGVSHQITPFVFVTRKDGPVRTLQDFKGRTVTTWFTGANHVLNAILAKEGIKPDEVKIQPQQVSVTPFVDGATDVATATYYNELYAIQSRVGRDNLRTFVAEDYGVTFPRDTLIVSETTLREKPDLVKGFLRASIRGWRDAFADPKGAVDTVMAIAPTLDRAHQDFMLTEVKRLMTAGAAKERGLFAIDPDALAKAQDLLLQAKVVAKPVDLKAAFDSRALDALSASDRQL